MQDAGMGVDHGGGQGGHVPPEFGVGGTIMQIVPRIFCHISTKMSVLWPSKYAKIRFLAGAPPRTPLGELTTLPQTSGVSVSVFDFGIGIRYFCRYFLKSVRYSVSVF